MPRTEIKGSADLKKGLAPFQNEYRICLSQAAGISCLSAGRLGIRAGNNQQENIGTNVERENSGRENSPIDPSPAGESKLE